jgi:hypothetical protein
MARLAPVPPFRADCHPEAARPGVLTAWRRGGRIAVLVGPAGAALGLLTPAAAAAVLGTAVVLAAAIALAAPGVVRRYALQSGLSDIPEVARARARMSDAAHRDRLAAELRHFARLRVRSAREARLVPPERLALARGDLFRLADALERAEHADPALLEEISVLLRDGTRSPLLNAEIAAHELRATLRRAMFRLVTDPAPRGGRGAAPPAHEPGGTRTFV